MAIREMVTCTRCGKTNPLTMRSRIHARRLLFGGYGFTIFDVATKSIDLCKDCWKDFEEFVYKYKED